VLNPVGGLLEEFEPAVVVNSRAARHLFFGNSHQKTQGFIDGVGVWEDFCDIRSQGNGDLSRLLSARSSGNDAQRVKVILWQEVVFEIRALLHRIFARGG